MIICIYLLNNNADTTQQIFGRHKSWVVNTQSFGHQVLNPLITRWDISQDVQLAKRPRDSKVRLEIGEKGTLRKHACNYS